MTIDVSAGGLPIILARRVLSWDKPERIMTVEAWRKIGADSAPPGVYTPNMSDEDQAKWKATLKRKTTEHPQVEIRKSVRGSQMLIIVALDGWTYKGSGWVEGEQPEAAREHLTTSGYNVRVSMNGPLWLTWDDMDDLRSAVQEARAVLEHCRVDR